LANLLLQLHQDEKVLMFSPNGFMRTSNCWIILMKILRLRGNDIQRFALLDCPRVLVDEEHSSINATNMGSFLLVLLGMLVSSPNALGFQHIRGSKWCFQPQPYIAHTFSTREI
jgi:hypothetical protein